MEPLPTIANDLAAALTQLRQAITQAAPPPASFSQDLSRLETALEQWSEEIAAESLMSLAEKEDALLQERQARTALLHEAEALGLAAIERQTADLTADLDNLQSRNLTGIKEVVDDFNQKAQTLLADKAKTEQAIAAYMRKMSDLAQEKEDLQQRQAELRQTVSELSRQAAVAQLRQTCLEKVGETDALRSRLQSMV
jgi:chromosome segregation ATPase